MTAPYSFDVQKYTNIACCGIICTPTENGIHDLTMQRQPTPCMDPLREGHFLRRLDVLAEIKSQAALTELTDLPSNTNDKKKLDTNAKSQRDTNMGKPLA